MCPVNHDTDRYADALVILWYPSVRNSMFTSILQAHHWGKSETPPLVYATMAVLLVPGALMSKSMGAKRACNWIKLTTWHACSEHRREECTRTQRPKNIPCTGIGKGACNVDILSEALIQEQVKGWCWRRLSAYIGLRRIALLWARAWQCVGGRNDSIQELNTRQCSMESWTTTLNLKFEFTDFDTPFGNRQCWDSSHSVAKCHGSQRL